MNGIYQDTLKSTLCPKKTTLIVHIITMTYVKEF